MCLACVLITANSFDKINWEATKRQGDKMTKAVCIWLTKHVFCFTATGHNMVCWKEWSNLRCPRCGYFGKDSNHIVVCLETNVWHTCNNAVLKLKDKLERVNTHPIITNIIILTLMGGDELYFCDMMPVDKNMTYDTIIQTIACASLKQDEIGWNNFVEENCRESGKPHNHYIVGKITHANVRANNGRQ